MSIWLRVCLLLFTFGGLASAHAAEPQPTPFVMQMTGGDSDAQRRAFLQIARVLEDIGPKKVKIEVVAYEGGISSLLSDNHDTATLLAALAREGVRFKACRISMRGHGFTDNDFPMEVEMEGYRYWRP